MERVDKIFVVLAALALLVILIIKATPAQQIATITTRKGDVMKVPKSSVMQSEMTFGSMRGPAYLTSNLPVTRENDEYMPRISVGAEGASATGALAV